ncbi:MAG: hypothetical protein ABUT39_03350 [Acidobacteriota bacterium]
MSRRTLTALLLLLVLLVPAAVRGRDPGGEFKVTSETSSDQIEPTVSMGRDGRFAVLWGAYSGVDRPGGTFLRLFSAGGSPVTEDVRVGSEAGDDQGPFSVSLDDAGVSAVWGGYNQHSGPNAYFRRLDRSGSPLSDEIYLGRKAAPSVATDRQGRAIVLFGDGKEVGAWRFDPLGRPLGGPSQVARSGAAPVVVRGSGGGFIAAWMTGTGIAGSLLDASGRPTVPFRAVESPTTGSPSLAAGPDGRFAVAWSSAGGLRLRLFRASGAPRTGILHVTDGDPNYEGPISLAMDAAGRILAVWSVCDPSFRGCHVFGQRFEASGTPSGGPFQIDSDAYGYDVVAAAGPAGRFVAVWARHTEETGGLIYGRLLTWALPGDAPCVRRGNRFLCDLAHDGGEEEIELSFGRGADRPLLGDFDGDGRDDPCVYRDGRLLCDTAHDGGAAEVGIAFGQDGDVPLLADLDGEGRDDPCLCEEGRFLCDADHDGTTELVIPFGQPGDQPLLGDPNGL